MFSNWPSWPTHTVGNDWQARIFRIIQNRSQYTAQGAFPAFRGSLTDLPLASHARRKGLLLLQTPYVPFLLKGNRRCFLSCREENVLQTPIGFLLQKVSEIPLQGILFRYSLQACSLQTRGQGGNASPFSFVIVPNYCFFQACLRDSILVSSLFKGFLSFFEGLFKGVLSFLKAFLRDSNRCLKAFLRDSYPFLMPF